MPVLPSNVKRFIVRSLACFCRPVDVQRQVRESFGITVPSDQIAYYDPSNAKGDKIADDLRALFQEEREKYLKVEQQIPVAHRAVRLRYLQEIMDNPRFEDNPHQIRETITLAEKILGGYFVRRLPVDYSTMTDAEIIAFADELKRESDKM